MANEYAKIEGLFVDLMSATIEQVLKTIKSGTADAKDIRNAITLLKDNGFTMRDVPTNKKPDEFLAELAKSIPALPNITPYGEIIDIEDEEQD